MKKELLLAVATVALLTACNDHADTPVTQPDRVPLALTAGIQTRAHDASWDVKDSIGVFMLNQSQLEAENKPYFTALGDGSFETAKEQMIYFPIDGTKRDFIAYYPYSKNLGADKKTLTIDVTNQNPQKAIDLMGAAQISDKSKEEPNVAFSFTHKLTKLVLAIEAGEGLTNEELFQTTVRLTEQQTTATYDVLGGGAVNVLAGTPASLALVAAVSGRSAEAIVLPNADTQGMKFQFTVPNVGTFEWAVKNAAQSQRFEAGKKYIYTIKINKTALNVTSTVEDWLPGNGAGETGHAK